MAARNVVGFNFRNMQHRRIRPEYREDFLRTPSILRGSWPANAFDVLDEFDALNIMPTEGLNYLLNAAFAGATQITAVKVGLYSANYSAIAADTLATFIASATEVTAYAGGNRLAFTPNTVAAGVYSNSSSPTVFTFNGSATVWGGFLTNSVAQGNTTGTLISAVKLGAAKVFASAEQLVVPADITLASS